MSRATPSSTRRAAADDLPPAHPGAARALVERQLAVLGELAEIGMEIARAAGARAVEALDAEKPVPPHPDPTLAYARAARAVRMAIALQARLLNELPALERGESRALAERMQARKRRIVRLVEQAIEADPAHEDRSEALADAAWERLRDADEYSALMALPLGEAVARICAELGLAPDAWVGEGSPFAPTASERGAMSVRDGVGNRSRQDLRRAVAASAGPLPRSRASPRPALADGR